MEHQDLFKKHSDFIWDIANLLRGPYRPPQYRRVMIPLTVLRRLDCVLEASKDKVLAEYKLLKTTDKFDDELIEKMICRKFELNFYNTSEFTFKSLLADPNNLARNLVNYLAGFSNKARKILDKFNFEVEIERLEDANRLFEVIKAVAALDLHPGRVPNMAMGYIFEDLVRRFNEQANEEAGDHFTPREVIKLMVNLLFNGQEDVYTAGKVIRIYDPTCGTGGMLSESEKHILEENPRAHVELYGQEYNPESYAICGSDLMIKGENTNQIMFGDTLGTGRGKEGVVDGDGHPDETFHYMLANPPFGVEWKPEQDYVTDEHNKLGFNGRFGAGLPRINDGALLFLQHMLSKRVPSETEGGKAGEGSRIAVVFNGSPLFTGDAGSGESNIRRWIIENDWLEAVVGLPDQLFYNTGISTYIWIVTNRKSTKRKGKVQLINAADFAWKMKKSLGDKRKKLGEGETENGGFEPNHIDALTRIHGAFQHEQRLRIADIQTNIEPDRKKKRDQDKSVLVSKIFDNRDFGYLKITVERPLRLNFSITDARIEQVKEGSFFTGLASSKKRKDLAGSAAEIAAGQAQQAEILAILEGLKSQFAAGELVHNRDQFEKLLKSAFKGSAIGWGAPLKKALLSKGALGEQDPEADICRDAKGNPEPDADLRDTENVSLPADIPLPLPLAYESNADKGKVDKSALLRLVRQHCEDYLAREVLPYRPDAWIDFDKTKVGYEIPFNRHFYEYEAPRPLTEIEAEIKALEGEIMAMLSEVV
ncbi:MULTISPECIES: class I SAM-dependent DNA methyltransferase [unclassified Pseudomonas]|uniref:type I restriction-modification system subunit M n=1 Tax=unclassified Pseudomonas TaxID=196821 RepID=UPI00244B8E79|nr:MULTISPECIES: class I SAM-dependent DNA methyltransferase [unclassified Pseudomonas]MDG9927892.1 type I restriction-modification system subunit M [Pseudomonas sp. GD04042]MDH0481901.1 type I restriction-modification system subunit M [Pseudomonas sp. GD04015]MDH0606464.1 type I restriction-modification system subunit M [Pseudomonas sp. GD03869]